MHTRALCKQALNITRTAAEECEHDPFFLRNRFCVHTNILPGGTDKQDRSQQVGVMSSRHHGGRGAIGHPLRTPTCSSARCSSRLRRAAAESSPSFDCVHPIFSRRALMDGQGAKTGLSLSLLTLTAAASLVVRPEIIHRSSTEQFSPPPHVCG